MADDIYRLSHTAKQLDEAITQVSKKVDISDFITSDELDEMWGKSSSSGGVQSMTVYGILAGKSILSNTLEEIDTNG